MRYILFACTFLWACCSIGTAAVKIDIEDGEGFFSVRMQNEEQGHIYLRSPKEGDLGHYQSIFGSPIAMEKYMNGIPRPAAEIERRYNDYVQNAINKSPWNSYLIFTNDDNFIGHVMLEPSDRDNPNEAEISYVILPEFWRKGITKAAVRMVIDASKTHIAAHYPINGHTVTQIYATARPDNPGSCLVLEHNGFALASTEEKFGVERNFYELKL